ncbi:hypothetical protein [Acidiplasma cupricumulans]|uniref:hypothetical protein n=1 Tax=Acidiplasma cupricumulans TaxID=312540 RepID=UPI0015852ADB|nr:hypothetical protein [Acidiplasma cupricumulans]
MPENFETVMLTISSMVLNLNSSACENDFIPKILGSMSYNNLESVNIYILPSLF